MVARGGWEIQHHRASPEVLHHASALALGELSGRLVRIHHPVSPAVVLGSAQPASHVNAFRAKAAGLDVVRRRSGGGAVLVRPDDVVWVDLFIPVGDPLWEVDVGRAMWWVGAAWAGALAALTTAPPRVWQGPLCRNEWSDRVCFAGLGPGEVTVDGRKVVGISQRRTRAGALFQTALLRRWDPEALLSVLELDPSQQERAGTALSAVAIGVPGLEEEEIISRLVAALST
jgi:lipoate-protein ligase A